MKRLVLILFSAAAFAAPVIHELSPRGAQRGRTFTLYLRGEGLLPGSRLETTLPAGISRLSSARTSSKPNTELPFLVELDPKAAVGLYPLRLVTDDGISNVLLFSVGDLPETEEKERENSDPKLRNDSIEKAEPAQIPNVINGTLAATDVDIFAFNARAGQTLVFEVEARRAGSAIDPVIEILDSAGRQIAANDDSPGAGVDPRLKVTFPREGRHYVRIHDARYSMQEQNFYRLKLGSFAYAEALFPLGWKRGEAIEVSLLGGTLAAPLRVAPKLDSSAPYVAIHLPGSPSLPLQFALSDKQEVLEPESEGTRELRENVVVNGRISRPGEVDRYRLAVAPGERWLFELTASSLGTSQLDAVLSVLDASGKKLASRDDVTGVDPALPWTAPEGAREVYVAVEDLVKRGGPAFGYRLLASRQPPDFTVTLATPYVNVPAGGTAIVSVEVQRRGYGGPIRLMIPNAPANLRVEGGHVPAESAAQRFTDPDPGFYPERSVLTITAPPDAGPQVVELSVVGVAETPQGRIERRAIPPGMMTAVRGDKQRPFTAPWLGMALAVAISKPLPMRFDAVTPLARFVQGFEWRLDYRAERRPGMTAPVKISQDVAGDVGNLRILHPVDKYADTGHFLVNTNFATPVTTFDMLLEAETEIDGKPVSIPAPAVTIEVVPGYEIRLDQATRELNPGGETRVRGTVRREPTFEGGLVRIRAEELPEEVSCDAVEVPADRREFTISCRASATAKPGSYEIRLASVAPDTGRNAKADYKIPDLHAQLVVAGSAAASR